MNPQPELESRHVTAEVDPRERFVLYRLCDCTACEGSGKGRAVHHNLGVRVPRCPECRGEGRIRQEIASCETPEAVGVALVTLGREGEWNECPLGLLDRTPECERCEGTGNATERQGPCSKCQGSGVKQTGTWLVLPWLPSPRNASDAGKLLRSRRK